MNFEEAASTSLVGCVAVPILLLGISAQSWAGPNPIQTKDWAIALLETVSQMPRMQAIESNLSASRYMGKAGTMPVYNPELDASYDDKVEKEYALSLIQTLDWSGKRTARKNVAGAEVQVAFYQFRSEKEQILADSLRSLNLHEAAVQTLDLVEQQVASMKQLVDVVDQRHEAGDLGMLDVELARFSYAETLYQLAQAQSDYRNSIAEVDAQLGGLQLTSLPEFDWTDNPSGTSLKNYLLDLPSVRRANAQLEAASKAVEVAESESKADPTFGIGTGRDGDETVVQMSVSIPLNVRNRFTNEIRAKQQDAITAELTYINERRVALSRLTAASESYQVFLNNWRRWQQLVATEFDQNNELLQQLWVTGEIETATYVFGQQQRTQAMLAGIEFQHGLFEAWIDWLETSGQVDRWLNGLAHQNTLEQ